MESSQKLARVISHKVRTDKRKQLHYGDWACVDLEDKSHIKGRYVGPARVVGGHSRLVLLNLQAKSTGLQHSFCVA